MSAPQSLLQAALNRLAFRFGSGVADAAATVATLAQEAPERLRSELLRFWQEVEQEAERLEADVVDLAGPPEPPLSPQEQIDALRAKVAELSRRFEERPSGQG